MAVADDGADQRSASSSDLTASGHGCVPRRESQESAKARVGSGGALMRRQRLTLGLASGTLVAVSALVATGFGPLGAAAGAAQARHDSGGTVLQTNLVSDLPGAA